MHPKLSPGAALLLTISPFLWAANAVVGRLVSQQISPMTLNFLRWVIAFALLAPLAGAVLRPGSALWPNWRPFSLLGLLSVGSYNALLYLALNSSTPLNVTLVGSSTPVWMLLIGRVFFQVPVSRRQLLGALLSISGVLWVICRGQPQALLQVRLVAGDLYVLLASMAWAYYSWMLAHPTTEPPAIRSSWSAFFQPDAAVYRRAVGRFSGRDAAPVSRRGVRTDHGWHCRVVAAYCA